MFKKKKGFYRYNYFKLVIKFYKAFIFYNKCFSSNIAFLVKFI